MVERYSLPFLPLAHGAHEAAPALSIGKERGRELADGLHVEIAERAAAGVGDVTARPD